MNRLWLVGVITLLAVVGGCGGPEESTLVNRRDRYALTILRAEVAEQTAQNNDWDADKSPPDVRVVIECPGGDRIHTTVVESFTPEWNSGACIAEAGDWMDDGFNFWVEDDDLTASDSVSANIELKPRDYELAEGELIIRGSLALKSITLRFDKQ